MGQVVKHKGPESMENTRPKVLVTRKLPAVVENRLRSTYEVRLKTDIPTVVVISEWWKFPQNIRH